MTSTARLDTSSCAYGHDLSPEVAAAVQRAQEFAEDFKRHVAGGAASAEELGPRTSSGADAAPSALYHVPNLMRIKHLTESPEKAAIAIAKSAVSTVIPSLAPIVGAAARIVEKEVDRSQIPVHLP